MFKVIVAGGREFDDYELLKSKLNLLLSNKTNVMIIEGGANGADRLARRYAKEFGIPYRTFHADWSKYGRKAGPIRNREMAENADALVAFWDGASRGTANMINQAKNKGLQVRVQMY